MIDRNLFIIILSFSFLYCNYNSNNNKEEAPEIHIKGVTLDMNYIDTIIGKRRLKIDYNSNNSVSVLLEENNRKKSTVLNRSDLPEWFDPESYNNTMDLLYFNTKKECNIIRKVLIINDSLIIFPLFDKDGLFNLCCLKATTDSLLKATDNLLPINKYLPNITFFSAVLDESSSRIAYSQFFPTRQSYSTFDIINFHNSTHIIKKISKDECPYSTYTSDSERIIRYRCLHSKIF